MKTDWITRDERLTVYRHQQRQRKKQQEQQKRRQRIETLIISLMLIASVMVVLHSVRHTVWLTLATWCHHIF